MTCCQVGCGGPRRGRCRQCDRTASFALCLRELTFLPQLRECWAAAVGDDGACSGVSYVLCFWFGGLANSVVGFTGAFTVATVADSTLVVANYGSNPCNGTDGAMGNTATNTTTNTLVEDGNSDGSVTHNTLTNTTLNNTNNCVCSRAGWLIVGVRTVGQ